MGLKASVQKCRLPILGVVFLVAGCASTPGKKENSEFAFWLEKAAAQYETGLLTEAEASYRKVSRIRPDSYEPWLRLGNIYVRTGQLEAAVRMFEKCTELRPDDIRGWSNLSLTRLKQSLAVLDNAQHYFPSDTPGSAILARSREALIEHLVK